MKNVQKHSFKCNKRDKLEVYRVRYEVVYFASNNCEQSIFISNTKYDCLAWLANTTFANRDKCRVVKVVKSIVLS